MPDSFSYIPASISTGATNAITALTGGVSATGPGSAAATVNSVGGSSAANVHSAELLANAATSTNTANAIVKRDANGNFTIFGSTSTAQRVYVDKTGNDSTGDGTFNKPYLTVQAAVNSITDATDTKRYIIYIGAGFFNETVTLTNSISLHGVGLSITKIAVVNYTGTNVAGFVTMIIASIQITTLTTDTSAVTGGVNITLISTQVSTWNITSDLAQAGNNFANSGSFISNVNLNQGNYQASGLRFSSTNITIADSPGAYADLVCCHLQSTVTVNGRGAIFLTGCDNSATMVGVTASATKPTIQFDPSSYPQGSFTPTDWTVAYTSPAKSVGFTPAISGNWSPVPVDAGDALDTLAATLATAGTVTSVGIAATGTGNPLTVNATPVTTSGTINLTFALTNQHNVFAGNPGTTRPTFRALASADIPSLDASKITTGVLPTTLGGTNVSAAGTAANVLTSDGANWTSAIPAVASVAPAVASFITVVNDGNNNLTVDMSLPDASIYVGNNGNQANGVPMSGDVSIVDTGATTVNTVGGVSAASIAASASGLFGGASPASNAVIVFNNGHVKSTQTTPPTTTINSNAGTGASSSVSNATDVAGHISLTLGTIGTLAAGEQTKINFNTAYNVAPIVVVTPTNATAASNQSVFGVYVTSTTTDFSINFATAGVALASLTYNYQVIETQ